MTQFSRCKVVLVADRVFVVGDKDTVEGFRLAGVIDCFQATQENIEGIVQEILLKESAGILVITHEAFTMLSQKLRNQASASAKPVLAVIPGKREAGVEASELSELIKKAIGVDIK